MCVFTFAPAKVGKKPAIKIPEKSKGNNFMHSAVSKSKIFLYFQGFKLTPMFIESAYTSHLFPDKFWSHKNHEKNPISASAQSRMGTVPTPAEHLPLQSSSESFETLKGLREKQLTWRHSRHKNTLWKKRGNLNRKHKLCLQMCSRSQRWSELCSGNARGVHLSTWGLFKCKHLAK